jgi:ornithine carbamoyltransferase
LKGRDLLTLADLSAAEIHHLLDTAKTLKRAQKGDSGSPTGDDFRPLAGRTLALIFEKPSLRTRATFAIGMQQLGGQIVDLAAEHLQMGVRETVPDVAKNLERWVDVIMARVFQHATLEILAEHASIPVINGLSDYAHPCQILADLLTMQEHKGDLAKRKIAYVGDGYNVTNSLLFAAGVLGYHMAVGSPEGYLPPDTIVTRARGLAAASGATLELSQDPVATVEDADVIYTDSWISMGLEAEAAARERVFPPYQVNTDLLRHARPDAIVMHCLPAHRGMEITDEMMDGPQSVVFDQAENRLHAQKAVLVELLVGGIPG